MDTGHTFWNTPIFLWLISLTFLNYNGKADAAFDGTCCDRIYHKYKYWDITQSPILCFSKKHTFNSFCREKHDQCNSLLWFQLNPRINVWRDYTEVSSSIPCRIEYISYTMPSQTKQVNWSHSHTTSLTEHLIIREVYKQGRDLSLSGKGSVNWPD